MLDVEVGDVVTGTAVEPDCAADVVCRIVCRIDRRGGRTRQRGSPPSRSPESLGVCPAEERGEIRTGIDRHDLRPPLTSRCLAVLEIPSCFRRASRSPSAPPTVDS